MRSPSLEIIRGDKMTDFFLITGFLGAGKTTLLKTVFPLFNGKKTRLIINEFGKVGLDGALLRESGAEIAEIVNGSIFCVCRLDQFERALENAMADRPDAIIVETSGLSDPGAIRSILAEYELAGVLRYRGAICLVDAPRFLKIVETARACKKQLAVADLILLNKCDMVNEEACALVERRINGLCLAPVLRTTFGMMTREQLDQLSPLDHAAEIDHRPDLTLQKETIELSGACTSSQVRRMLALLAEDTYRIKGFLALSDGRFVADCVGTDIRVTRYAGQIEHTNQLTLLAGEGMQLRHAIRQLMGEFSDLVVWKKGQSND
jgi:G3E family GTPase